MHASFYLSLLAIMYFYMSFSVIRLRRREKVSYGIGDGKGPLAGAVSSHSNFASYTPIFLILLIMAENQWHLPLWVVHPIGVAFVVGRLFHFQGLTKKEHQSPPNFRFRITGMMLTFFPIMVLSLYIIVMYTIKLNG